MKNFKKITSLILALMLVLSLTACFGGDDDKKDKEEPAEPSSLTTTVPGPGSAPVSNSGDAQKVSDYVNENASLLSDSFEGGFASSGLSCDCIIKANGTRIILNCNVIGFNNLTSSQKSEIQSVMPTMESAVQVMLDAIRLEVPEVTGIDFNMCEEDGDIIASLSI